MISPEDPVGPRGPTHAIWTDVHVQSQAHFSYFSIISFYCICWFTFVLGQLLARLQVMGSG